jgi:DNA-binding response OmpR family regulator
MPSAVLVAEPEPETREYLGRQLRDDGFDVLGAARRSEALELAESARPDVVLLAELELCLRLRRGEPGRTWDRNVPVIVLAPSSDPVDRVRALDRGADDVMGRPFAYEELLARIRALIRRSSAAAGDVIVAGDLVIDRPTRRVRVRDTGVTLSAKEFELVAKLASEPQRVFTKEELLREVWGYRALGRTRTLESHASRVRKKLCLDPDDRFIVNVWGVARRVAGVVGTWREVASGLGFPHLDGMGVRIRSRTFGHGLGTQRECLDGRARPAARAREGSQPRGSPR